MFTLTEAHLQKLFELNEFPVPNEEMVFVGLRGCLPVNPEDHNFRAQQNLESTNVNHISPRCTLMQWRPKHNDFAVYPGSTVPHRKYLTIALQHNGEGANQLLTGFYDDYRKGVHKASKPTGHPAFRQTAVRAYRRTADDLTFEADDRVEFGNPVDNLHAGWCHGVGDVTFASAGCQVVVGFPKCLQRGNNSMDTGPWKTFKVRAYSLSQNIFGYALFDGSADARRIALSDSLGMERVRFGSVSQQNNSRVKRVQQALKDKDFFEGNVDGDFGPRSMRALLEFQAAEFGSDAVDGICGPQTAAALNIQWP